MSNSLPPVALDEDIEDADWLRRRAWDMQARTVAEFLAALGVADADRAKQQHAVDLFMRLPVARNMPASLRQSLRQARLL